MIAVTLVIGLVLLAGAYLLVAKREDASYLLKPKDAEVVARGERVYAEHCASCHGANLEGEPEWRSPKPEGTMPAPPHDGTGHTWHHPDELLFQLTKYGVQAVAPEGYKSDMPAFEGVLSDEEIVAVLSFIKAQWPEELQKNHDALSKQK
jgi:mono/diheme cytochrome c family protein